MAWPEKVADPTIAGSKRAFGPNASDDEMGEGPPIPYGESTGGEATIKVRVGAVIKTAKRWIKVGGKLINA